MSWILFMLLIGVSAYAVSIYHSRQRFTASLLSALAAIRQKDDEIAALRKPLTQKAVKVQDSPKRFSGAQLRRLAEHANTETMASLQERPNSEILQEQENV